MNTLFFYSIINIFLFWMMLPQPQSVFQFCKFLTGSVFVVSVAVFSLGLFLSFATFLVTRPWRRLTGSVFVVAVAVFSIRLFLRFATFLVTRPWRRHRIFTATKDHSSPPYCAVCLQEADDGEKMKRLTICHHYFHADCIDQWLCEMSTCPLCRAEIPPLPPANPLLVLFVPAVVIDLFSNKSFRGTISLISNLEKK